MSSCVLFQDSSVAYRCLMDNGHTILLHVYLVYDTACEVSTLFAPSGAEEEEKYPPEDGHKFRQFQWGCVDRHSCTKGCKGPILRPMMRYAKPRASPKIPRGGVKKPSSMHLSIDEASNHVGSRFRYDQNENTILLLWTSRASWIGHGSSSAGCEGRCILPSITWPQLLRPFGVCVLILNVVCYHQRCQACLAVLIHMHMASIVFWHLAASFATS